jgi:hypothetical protein
VSRPKPEFYRSEFTRWLFIICGALAGWSISPWGPKPWHETPSLQLIHTVIPWPIMTALFGIYVLLLVWGRLESVVAGCILGLGLYLCALIALVMKLDTHVPANLIATVALVLTVGYHYHAAKLARLQSAIQREAA